MVYLDDDNEVKGLSNVLDPASTDAIIVAGDDNLLAKVNHPHILTYAYLDSNWAFTTR